MGKLSFQKLTLAKEPIGEPIEVQFNPTEYSFEKSARLGEVSLPGLDSPIIQFVRGESEKLTLELFFDATDRSGNTLPGPNVAGTGGGGGQTSKGVVQDVDAFYRLVKVDGDLHAPPLVRITWGEAFPGATTSGSDTPSPNFDAVVESVNRRFTLFDGDGVPLRCVVNLTLREYRTLDEQLRELNLRSADHTRLHTVREGETLPLIAHLAYADPARWRTIATANDLADPTELTPGQVLELPPIA